MIVHELFTREHVERVNLVMATLEALKLVQNNKTDYAKGFAYTGPDVDAEARNRLFAENKDEFGLRGCLVSLKRQHVDESIPLPKIWKTPYRENQRLSNLGYIRRKEWTEEKYEEEKQRSIANEKVVCKCGSSKDLDTVTSHGQKRSKVMVGGKRRTRCKNCEGCKAPRCEQCPPCLKPSLKKPCLQKVCLFPVIPKCPCFM